MYEPETKKINLLTGHETTKREWIGESLAVNGDDPDMLEAFWAEDEEFTAGVRFPDGMFIGQQADGQFYTIVDRSSICTKSYNEAVNWLWTELYL